MNQFKPSELILNADGSIYHLNLLPEDLADTIITVGDPHRVPRVSQYLDRIEVMKEKREFRTHTGYIGQHRISVMSTGIGSGNIDIFMNELDALVNIDLQSRRVRDKKKSLRIIRLGTSGSIHPDVNPDEFLVSSGAIGLDATMAFYTHRRLEEFEEFLTVYGVNDVWHYWAPADEYSLSLVPDTVHRGITLTAPGFYGAQNRSLRLPYRISLPFDVLHSFRVNDVPTTNLEMETACIYAMAALLGHRALSMNCILANRLDGSFSQTPEESIDRLIRMTLEMLSSDSNS